MNDKKNILSQLDPSTPVAIELGCGGHKKNHDAIGIDLLDFPDVDLVGDVYEILSRFPDGSVSRVYGYHFVEHVADLERLLSLIERITVRDGMVEFIAPHFTNPYFYSDPTHKHFFGLYTFGYYTERSIFKRKVPTYGFAVKLLVERVDLVFKSDAVFPVRYGLKRILGLLFNSSNFMREFYEENLCYLFPCYEVRYLLRRL